MGKRDDILSKIHPRYHAEIEAARRAPRKPLQFSVTEMLAPIGEAIAKKLESEIIGIEPAPGVEKPRVRQKQRKISLLEERWGREIRSKYPDALIIEQYPLAIGNGCNYYLDYLIVRGERQSDGHFKPTEFLGHEVKGPYSRANGITKLKGAATRYPFIWFSLVSESKYRGWVTEAIHP